MKPIRILLVEDNPDDRFMIKRGIQRGLSSPHIIEAHRKEILDQAIQLGEFDIVVTDYNLGWTNGIDILKSVKKQWPQVPVILTTILDEEKIAIQAMQAGLDTYVVKSISQFALMGDTISSVLEQKENAKALREAQTRYFSLSESVPVGLFRTRLDGTQLEVNQYIVNKLHYPDKETLLAVNSHEMYDDPALRSEKISLMMEERAIITWEETLKTYDGKRKQMLVSAHIVFDQNDHPLYLEGYVQDISEQRRVEKALETSEVVNQTIIENVQEGVLVTDKELKIIVWNQYLEHLSGIASENAIGRPANQFFTDTFPRETETAMRQALSGKTIYAPDTAISFPESPRQNWIELTYSPLKTETGEVIGVVVTIHDITERKENETEREQLLAIEKKRSRELTALTTASTTISSNLQINQVLTVVAEQMIELLNADSCSICSWDADRSTIHTMVTYSPSLSNAASMTKEDKDISSLPEFKTVLEDHQVVKITLSDGKLSPGLRTEMSQKDIQSLMIIPLIVQERAIGCVQLEDHDQQRDYQNQEIFMAQMLANQAAVALENARLYEELEDAYIQTIIALANTVDIRDTYTHDHSQRIAILAQETGEAIGISNTDLENLRWGALLHDIGKIGIPDEILRKPGNLTTDEFEIIKKHPALGAAIIAPVKKLAPVVPIIRAHQEKYDGTGYPDGLAGEQIPISARILAVVDAYIAITDERVYRKGRTHEEAIEELLRCAGTQFDPAIVDTFIQVAQFLR